MNYLIYSLMEGKLEDVINKHSDLSDGVIQGYLNDIPEKNARYLDWVLDKHKKGQIDSDVKTNLIAFNKNKEKLPKKQIEQYKTYDELKLAISPHIELHHETIYESPTMKIVKHHTHDAIVKAASLSKDNLNYNKVSQIGKAQWCVSVDNSKGNELLHHYTNKLVHPFYTIDINHGGINRKYALVADSSISPSSVQLVDEQDAPFLYSGFADENHNHLTEFLNKNPELNHTPLKSFLNMDERKLHKKVSNANVYNPNYDPSYDETMTSEGSDSVKANILAYHDISPNLYEKAYQNATRGIRFKLLNKKNCPDDLIKREMESNDNYISNEAQNVYLHKHSKPNPLDRYASSNEIDKALDSDDISDKLYAIRHENADINHITKALNDKFQLVRAEAVKKIPNNLNLINKAVADKSSSVKLNVLDNKWLNEKHLGALVKDEDNEVVKKAYTHKNLTPKLISDAMKDDYYRNLAIKNPNVTDDNLTQFYNHVINSGVDDQHIAHLLKLGMDNPSVTSNYLDKVYDYATSGIFEYNKHKFDLKDSVEKNKKISPETLDKAINFNLNSNRGYVVNDLLDNENVSSQSLSKIINKGDIDLVGKALRHANVDTSVIRTGLLHKSKGVSELAAKHKLTTMNDIDYAIDNTKNAAKLKNLKNYKQYMIDKYPNIYDKNGDLLSVHQHIAHPLSKYEQPDYDSNENFKKYIKHTNLSYDDLHKHINDSTIGNTIKNYLLRSGDEKSVSKVKKVIAADPDGQNVHILHTAMALSDSNQLYNILNNVKKDKTLSIYDRVSDTNKQNLFGKHKFTDKQQLDLINNKNIPISVMNYFMPNFSENTLSYINEHSHNFSKVFLSNLVHRINDRNVIRKYANLYDL